MRPTLCIGLTLWLFGINQGDDKRRSIKMLLGGALIVSLLTGIVIEGKRTGELEKLGDNVEMIVDNADAFWSGRYSLATHTKINRGGRGECRGAASIRAWSRRGGCFRR